MSTIEITSKIEALRDEIKAEMMARDIEELRVCGRSVCGSRSSGQSPLIAAAGRLTL